MAQASVEQHLDKLDFNRRLEADFGTELQLEIDGVSLRLPTQLVGMDVGNFLVVKTPTASQLGGVAIKLFQGNRVVVRYIYNGVVYGFETTIIDAATSPVRLVFLAYPKVVTERNIRSNQRIDTKLPAKLGAGEDASEGVISDISIDGCQFEVRNDRLAESAGALKVGDDVELNLQLPGVSGDFQVKGTIRNARRTEETTDIGVSFAELEESVQLAIDSYVKQSD